MATDAVAVRDVEVSILDNLNGLLCLGGLGGFGVGSADGPRGRAERGARLSLLIPLAKDPCANLSPTRTSPTPVPSLASKIRNPMLAV